MDHDPQHAGTGERLRLQVRAEGRDLHGQIGTGPMGSPSRGGDAQSARASHPSSSSTPSLPSHHPLPQHEGQLPLHQGGEEPGQQGRLRPEGLLRLHQPRGPLDAGRWAPGWGAQPAFPDGFFSLL